MRRDIIFAFLVVLGAHIAVALVPHRSLKRVRAEDDAPVVKIVIPPLPPPDEPEKEPEPTDTPMMAPPSLADIPTTVPVDAFVTPVEPPPPEGLHVGTITIPVSHANLNGVRIFDLADLDQQPEVRFRAPLNYPFEQKRNGITGTVKVGFICDYEGHVQEAHVVGSSGSTELDLAAVEGVSKWIFKPGRRGGHAVNARMEQPIVWTLGDQN